MKIKKTIWTIIFAIMTIGWTLAVLNVNTNINDALIYVKKVFLTNDGTPVCFQMVLL